MIKALMSFSLGGLVVFVPQGVKTQEKKPATVKEVQVVVLDDVTETTPERVRVQVSELNTGVHVVTQDPEVHSIDSIIKSVSKEGALGRLLQDPASQTELLHLLQRLEAMSVKVKSLDGHVRQMDLARGVYSKGRNGLPGKYLGQDQARKLNELERKMKEIAEMRDRLEAQIETTRRAIAKTKGKKDAADWQFKIYKDGKLVEQRQVRKDHVNVLNEARKRQVERDLLLDARAHADVATQAAKALGVKVDLARLHERRAAQQETKAKDRARVSQARKSADLYKRNTDLFRKNLAAQYKAMQGDTAVAKLEREVARLTRELQRMNATKGSRTGIWSVSPPKRTAFRPNPFVVRTAPAPRASGTQARRSPARANTYKRRPAPSTLGAEGKVIWNEMQSIRSDIRSLRLMLERHMKANAPGSRSGKSSGSSTRRGSVGRTLPGRIVSPSGVPLQKGSYGITTLGPEEVIIVQEAGPGKGTAGKVRHWYAPNTARRSAPPKAPKSGIGWEHVEYLPLPKRGESPQLRYKLEIPGEPEKIKSPKKSKTSRKRGTISWPGTTGSPIVNTKKSGEIRRL